MPTTRRLARLLRYLLRRPDAEAEIEDEMRMHLELETAELMAGGMSAEDARRHAMISFGGVQQAKEDALDDGGLWWLDNLRRDIRIATRTLMRQPTFAATAILALALAIAVNTTMFSVLDAMLNPTAGARNPGQLYGIWYFGDPDKRVDFTEKERILATGGRTYESYTGGGTRESVIEYGNTMRQVDRATVRPDFFRIMGIPPLEGALIPADPLFAAQSAIISDKMRAELFADDETPVGKTVTVDGERVTVLGVAPGGGVLNVDVWMFPAPREHIGVQIMRLRDGVTLHDADQELQGLAARLALAAGDSVNRTRFYLKPLARQFRVDRFHYALIGAGLAVLLVACTNLANLQFARALGRGAEIALRSSLGASRRQIVAQLMVESAVLAACALVLAVLLAIIGNAVLRMTIPPHVGEYVVAPKSNWHMVAFAALAAAVSMLVIGLIPAVKASRLDLSSLLKSRAGTGAHKSNRRTYGVLVVTQIALTLPLVCAAVLLSRSAWRYARIDLDPTAQYGYDPTPLIVARLSLNAPPAGQPLVLADVAGEFIRRAKSIDGVAEAALTVSAAPDNDMVTVDDDGAVREVRAYGWWYEIVSPGYARTFNFSISAGRDFVEGVYREPAIIMDVATAGYLWPRATPLGRTIKLGDARSSAPWLKVTGVLGDQLSDEQKNIMRSGSAAARMRSVKRVMVEGDSIARSVYHHYEATLWVRAGREPQKVLNELRHALRDATTQPARIARYRDVLGITQQMVVIRFVASLFATFGLLALGLSALGVYGIVAQSVHDRQREVAVRISLGATSRNIIYALLREGNVIVLAGIAIGLFLTKTTIIWLGEFINEVDRADEVFFGLMCVALFGLMVLAALVPALRATRLDPMQVLRAE